MMLKKLAILAIAVAIANAAPAGAAEPPSDTFVLYESSYHLFRNPSETIMLSWGNDEWLGQVSGTSFSPQYGEKYTRSGARAQYCTDTNCIDLAVLSGDDTNIGSIAFSGNYSLADISVQATNADRTWNEFSVDGSSQYVDIGAVWNDTWTTGVLYTRNGTFDMVRPTNELILPLPQTSFFGVYMEGDVRPGEDVVEDSFSLRAGRLFPRGSLELSFTDGSQRIRGALEDDNFSQVALASDVQTATFSLDSTLSLREVAPPHTDETLYEGRLFVDFEKRWGRALFGFGSYVNGFSAVSDDAIASSVGGGLNTAFRVYGNHWIGGWGLVENVEALQYDIARYGASYEWNGVRLYAGARTDEIGRPGVVVTHAGNLFGAEVERSNWQLGLRAEERMDGWVGSLLFSLTDESPEVAAPKRNTTGQGGSK